MNKHIPTNIFSLPSDSNGNLYFSLWRTAFQRLTGLTVSGVPRGGLLRLSVAKGNVHGYLIVIHWSTVLYGSKYTLKSLTLLFINILSLSILKMRGATIFWVIHNARAHDYPHPWIDRLGRALVLRLAHAVITHQESVRKVLQQQHPQMRITYIPHGNYIDAYGPQVSDRSVARKQYGFAHDEIIFLALGSIRPYKKLEIIIDSFLRTIGESDTSAKLWIIGKGDASYVRTLEQRAVSAGISICIENRFVPDEEISSVLASCSYSVFAYDDSELTSGGVVLSLSYGVPVISMRIPAVEMTNEGTSGFFYKDITSLSKLFKVLAWTSPPDCNSVMESIQSDTWDTVARSYIALYGLCKS